MKTFTQYLTEEDFHSVLTGAGYSKTRSLPGHDVYTHATRPKVGIMHANKLWATHALTNGNRVETPGALKAHLDKA